MVRAKSASKRSCSALWHRAPIKSILRFEALTLVCNTWFYLFLQKLEASDYLYFDLASDSDEGDFYSACDSSPLDAFFVAQPVVACAVSYHLQQDAPLPHRVEPGAHHLHHLTY